MKRIYYLAQNTGWTNGVSWFDCYEGAEYNSRAHALDVAQLWQKQHPEIETRVVKIVEERTVEVVS